MATRECARAGARSWPTPPPGSPSRRAGSRASPRPGRADSRVGGVRSARRLAEVEGLVERLLVHTVFERHLADGALGLHGFVNDLRAAVVPDVRVERGGDRGSGLGVTA